MMIFLPHASYPLSMHLLSAGHLGDAITGGVAILRLLAGHGRRSANWFHPSVDMWRGHHAALVRCVHSATVELERRGYQSIGPSPMTREGVLVYGLPERWLEQCIVQPLWLGHERLHASHRASLLHRDQDWYSQFAWTEYPVSDIWWPGRLPAAGELLVNKNSREVVLVLRMGTDHAECLSEYDGARYTITRRQIVLREWERAQRKST